jgi:16S rRNA (guanine966-N2)-methyltransferase
MAGNCEAPRGDEGPVRVIAGSAKGRALRPPRTSATRPITDRAKESLFSILGPRIPGRRFLDLFAGTGSVGIEALSRGAAHATFVERAGAALAGIRHNLDLTGLSARAEVAGRDVFGYLRDPPVPFDVIFVAPPQWRGLWPRAVALLDREPGWLADGAIVVAQHDPAESVPLDLAHLELASERTYGGVRFSFFAGRPRG